MPVCVYYAQLIAQRGRYWLKNLGYDMDGEYYLYYMTRISTWPKHFFQIQCPSQVAVVVDLTLKPDDANELLNNSALTKI